MSGIPRWLRPPEDELRRSGKLVRAVELLQNGEQERAAMILQELRAGGGFGPQVGALHAWSLLDAAAPADAAAVARESARRHGVHPSLSYVMAVTFELRDRPADALEHYRHLLQREPGDPLLLRAVARTSAGAGRPREALEHLELLAETGAGELPGDLELRARALEGAGRFREAAAVHERMAAERPGELPVLAAAAGAVHRMAMETADPELHRSAATLLEELTGLDPQHVDAWWKLGRSRHALDQDAEAESAWRRCLELQPDYLDAGLALADLLYDADDREGAGEVLLGMLRQPLSAEGVERVQAKMLEIES